MRIKVVSEIRIGSGHKSGKNIIWTKVNITN